MPLPSPKNESKRQFISRCMQDEVMKKEYEDEQRAAVCYSIWKDKKSSARASIEMGDEYLVE